MLAFVVAAIVVLTTPVGHLRTFSLYAVAVLTAIAGSRVSFWTLIWRCAAAVPVVLVSALLKAWQEDARAGGVLAAKALVVILLAGLLSLTTPWPELLEAFRRAHLPRTLLSVLTLTERYAHVLVSELRKMRRARLSRSVRDLSWRLRLHSEGQLFGALVLRGDYRAHRVQAAMLARGFHGLYPTNPLRPWSGADTVFLLMASGLFLGARFLGSAITGAAVW